MIDLFETIRRSESNKALTYQESNNNLPSVGHPIKRFACKCSFDRALIEDQ